MCYFRNKLKFTKVEIFEMCYDKSILKKYSLHAIIKEKVFIEVGEWLTINEYQKEHSPHTLFYCLFLFSRRTSVGIGSMRKIMVRRN